MQMQTPVIRVEGVCFIWIFQKVVFSVRQGYLLARLTTTEVFVKPQVESDLKPAPSHVQLIRSFTVSVKAMRKIILVLVFLLANVTASAETGGVPDFLIDRYTIDGGGGQSSGGAFTLTGTIGQPDANFSGAQGGVYGFVGGFWGSSIDFLFVDGFEGAN